MVELYWPRNTTFSLSTPSGIEKYRPGLHDVEEDRVEQFKARGWVDPSDDDVEVEIDREEEEETVTVEDESDDDGQDEEVELDEDELSLTSEPDLEDDTDDTTEADVAAAADAEGDGDGDGGDGEDEDDEFDAASFVDRTPQREVIDDIETGEYDEHLDEIAAAEESDRDRRGVERAVNARRDES